MTPTLCIYPHLPVPFKCCVLRVKGLIGDLARGLVRWLSALIGIGGDLPLTCPPQPTPPLSSSIDGRAILWELSLTLTPSSYVLSTSRLSPTWRHWWMFAVEASWPTTHSLSSWHQPRVIGRPVSIVPLTWHCSAHRVLNHSRSLQMHDKLTPTWGFCRATYGP